MKHLKHSLLAVATISSFAFSGGDIAPVPVLYDEDTSGFYLGAGLTAVSTRGYKEALNFFQVEGNQDRLGNFTLQGGYDFNQYVGVEGRYTISFTKEDIVEMSGWSLFVKPQYPVTESFSIYGLLGYGGNTLDGVNGVNLQLDDSAFQWGLGLSYAVTEEIVLFVDYTDLGRDLLSVANTNLDIDTDIDAITIGVTYHF